MNYSELEQEALRFYAKRKYDEALNISIELSKHLNNVGLYMSATILELGISTQGKNLQIAYKYFDLLRKNNDDEGYVGCARIMLQDNNIGSEKLAEEYCKNAIKVRENPYAYLVLGQVYEFMFGSSHYELATKSYTKAALRGATLGWRRIALLEKKKGNLLMSIIMHIFSTIVAPVYLIFGGMGTARNG